MLPPMGSNRRQATCDVDSSITSSSSSATSSSVVSSAASAWQGNQGRKMRDIEWNYSAAPTRKTKATSAHWDRLHSTYKTAVPDARGNLTVIKTIYPHKSDAALAVQVAATSYANPNRNGANGEINSQIGKSGPFKFATSSSVVGRYAHQVSLLNGVPVHGKADATDQVLVDGQLIPTSEMTGACRSTTQRRHIPPPPPIPKRPVRDPYADFSDASSIFTTTSKAPSGFSSVLHGGRSSTFATPTDHGLHEQASAVDTPVRPRGLTRQLLSSLSRARQSSSEVRSHASITTATNVSGAVSSLHRMEEMLRKEQEERENMQAEIRRAKEQLQKLEAKVLSRNPSTANTADIAAEE